MLAWVGLMVASFALMASPSAAENPNDLLADLADDGVYIAPSRTGEAEPGSFVSVIDQARADGVSLAIVWPADPQPNTGAFARRVQEASMIDVVLVYGPDDEFGSFVAEDFEEGSIRAAAAAREVSEPTNRASAFMTGLLDEPVRERPPIVNQLVRWIVILLVALIIGAVGEQVIRQFKKSRKRKKLLERSDTSLEVS